MSHVVLSVIRTCALPLQLLLPCLWAVYNHWTGLVDWTGGLTLKSIFMASNKTHWPVGLYDAL